MKYATMSRGVPSICENLDNLKDTSLSELSHWEWQVVYGIKAHKDWKKFKETEHGWLQKQEV